MAIIYILILASVVIIPLLIFVLLLSLKKRNRLKKFRSPFADNFLRSPGESLFRQIQNLNEEISLAQMALVFFPLFLTASLLITLQSSEKNKYIGIVIYCSALVLFSAYYVKSLFNLIAQRRLLLLGYDGEVAAGQEINQLMLDGYNVYHDFPADKFNIDHIVVGPDAVYAVETKAKSKSKAKDIRENFKVTSDGRTLQFLDDTSSEFIDQSDRQAKWLQKWLSGSVGDPVPVKPILLLPGWFIERTSPNGVPVFNPKMVRQFLSAKEKTLSNSLRTRIIHQLEQKCRDIEPETVKIERQ